ncbi:hypothetical protein Gotur_013171 [Gossypium turneri]
MEEELGNLSIIDKKENPFQAQEDESTLKEDYKLCLVGSYLAASVMYFPSMRNIVANLWHSIRGNGGAIQDNIWLGYIVKSPVEKRGAND